MKKYIFILVVFCLLLTPSLVKAQSSAPGQWVSSINIQNPTSSPAHVTLTFYDNAGVLKKTYTVQEIPAGGSRLVYTPSDLADIAAGQYAAVASSDAEVSIVINSSSTGPSSAGAYSGLTSGDIGTVLYFPASYNNYWGFYSELIIQNTTNSVAQVSVQFYNLINGSAVNAPYVVSIPSFSSHVFSLSQMNPALPVGAYSAKVTSSSAIGGVVNTWSLTKPGEYSTFNGATTGTTAAILPALYNNYWGFVSSLTVQNLDPTNSADVTVTYSNGVVSTLNLAPGVSGELYQPNNTSLPSGNTNGVFSAKVTSTRNVVAIVNVEDKTKGSLASYNAISNPTTTVLCPVVMKTYYKWFTAETIMNVGTVPATVSVLYANGSTFTTPQIPANGTYNLNENNSATLPAASSLAATFTSSQPISVIVQENSDLRYAEVPGDYLLAYSCTNK